MLKLIVRVGQSSEKRFFLQFFAHSSKTIRKFEILNSLIANFTLYNFCVKKSIKRALMLMHLMH